MLEKINKIFANDFDNTPPKEKVKICVMVSGGGTNLQALIDAQKSGLIDNGEIELVISSNQKAYALERAKKAFINTEVISAKEYDDKNEYAQKLMDTLKKHKIDLIVLAGFMSILSQNVTDEYSYRIINVHPALIPSFCGKGFYGLKVHQAALDYGVRVTGATVHFVNEVVDGGAIILQKAVDILPNDTAETLQKRVMEQAEWELLPKAVSLYCKGKISIYNNRVVVQE